MAYAATRNPHSGFGLLPLNCRRKPASQPRTPTKKSSIAVLSPRLSVRRAKPTTCVPAGGRQRGLKTEEKSGTYRIWFPGAAPMPKPARRVPTYRKHKPSGQAVVTLCGTDFYLGPHNSQTSINEYDRLIAEWLSNGRGMASGELLESQPTPAQRRDEGPQGIGLGDGPNHLRAFPSRRDADLRRSRSAEGHPLYGPARLIPVSF